jgi:hypothetical protein
MGVIRYRLSVYGYTGRLFIGQGDFAAPSNLVVLTMVRRHPKSRPAFNESFGFRDLFRVITRQHANEDFVSTARTAPFDVSLKCRISSLRWYRASLREQRVMNVCEGVAACTTHHDSFTILVPLQNRAWT